MNTKTNNLKGVAYLRVSSDSQEQEGHSLEVQEKDAIKKLTSLGISSKNIHIFNEGSHTGTTVKGRDQFADAIDFSINNSVDYFWVYSSSRLARDTEAAIKYFKLLSANSTKLITSSMDYKDTPEGMVTFGINAVIDEYYSKKLSEDVKKSHKALKDKGIYPHKAPLGYKNYRNDLKQERIMLDDSVHHLITEAFQMYADSQLASLNEVSDYFYDSGYRFKGNKKSNGTGRMSKQTLSRLMKNPFYYGKFEHEGRLVRHVYPPLTTEAIFNQVQDKLKKKVIRQVSIRSNMRTTL